MNAKFTIMISKLPPHPCLSKIVDYYWIEQNGSNRVRVLPDGTASIVFNLGSPVNIFGINGEYKNLESQFMIGTQKKYYILEEVNNTFLVGIKFTQGGAYSMIRKPMKDFSDKLVDLEEVVDCDVREIRKQIRKAKGESEIKKLLDYFMIIKTDMIEGNIKVVDTALKEVKENSSPALIKSFCEKENISNKHLISLFNKKVGVSPKLLQRLNKFTKVIFAVQNRKDFNWSELAYEFNYYDQAHLINEFKSFSGISPKVYLRNKDVSGLRISDV